MINIKGIEYYTAKDITEILQMKYSSVIFLLRENNFPKYKNKYIVTKDELEILKNRSNQSLKLFIAKEKIKY